MRASNQIRCLGLFGAVVALAGIARAQGPVLAKPAIDEFCVSCHGADSPKAGLNLSAVLSDDFDKHPQVWEKVIKRLRGRQMPPPGKDRPSEEGYVSILSQLET